MPLYKIDQNIGAFITFWAISLLLLYLGFGILGVGDEYLMLDMLGVIVLVSALVCLLTVRKYRKAGNPVMIDYLNIGVQRYILSIFMVMYGIDKLLGGFFDYQLFALDSKLNDVSEFQLAWFFYGKNHWQELFTGIMEFVPGLFLLHRRTYYVAAIILLPVTAQIFLLNLFFKIGGVTFPAAIILLACNLYILYSQKEKMILFFRSLNLNIVGRSLTGRTRTVVNTLKGAGFLLILLILFAKIKPAMFKSAQERRYQGMVGVYTLKEMKKNGTACKPVNGSDYYKDLYIEKQARWNILRRFDDYTEAFILRLSPRNDSMSLYLNKGGIGDGPDIIDSVSVLKGVYKLDKNRLIIHGVQKGDTLQLVYEKRPDLKAKDWFW